MVQLSNKETLLRVDNLKKYFPLKAGLFSRTKTMLRAVDGVSFTVNEGEVLGLVGESGCGKTTTGRGILRLIEPTSGQIVFNGKDVMSLTKKQMWALRQDITIIFQDPYLSLNPRMTVSEIVREGLNNFRLTDSKTETQEQTEILLEKVGLRSENLNRYPHEFSGGQRQRIGIARALSVNPKLIIADEPVSALDVSIQAQVLNLLVELKTDFQLTYIFIAHDLRVVEYVSDRVAVMYLGKIVELADARELYTNPRHPYTEALLSATPMPDPKAKKDRIVLSGEVPSPISPPSGCPFHPRCSYRKTECTETVPDFREVQTGHHIACHYPIN
jgi:oligopeptide/dipeptide ABC transporter ATP-binding protein